MNEDSSTLVGAPSSSAMTQEALAAPGTEFVVKKPARTRRASGEKQESARDALLRVMVHTIDEIGEPGVRLEKVLKDANASVSSMYHHFGNLSGLIESAQIVRFRRTQQLDLDYFSEELKMVKNREEFRGLLKRGMERAFHEDRRIIRSQRVNAAARSYQNPHYAAMLRDLQREANHSLMHVLLHAQAKGFIPSHVDIETAAAWWTGTTFGRFFVEILDDDALENRWNELAYNMALVVLDIAQ